MPSEFSVSFGAFGCLFAIILLIVCECHSISYYIRNRSTIASAQKKIMCMEFVMIILFLCPVISNVSLRHNYFISQHSVQQFSSIYCKISMVLTLPPYLCGKCILYIILMYRIYKVFESSIFAMNKKVMYSLITLLSFTILPYSISAAVSILRNSNRVVIGNAGDLLICQLEANLSNEFNHLSALPIVTIFTELFVCGYLIHSFGTKLHALRAIIYPLQKRLEKTVTSASTIDVADRHSTTEPSNPSPFPSETSTNDNNTSAKARTDTEKTGADVVEMAKSEAIFLTEITVKQTVLALSALTSSLCFYVAGLTMREDSLNFIGWDIMINTLSIHLMFLYSKFIWDAVWCFHVNSKTEPSKDEPRMTVIIHPMTPSIKKKKKK
eukprot:458676_1